MAESDRPTIPLKISAAIDAVNDAFYNSVPFQRVARVREARSMLELAISNELTARHADSENAALLAATTEALLAAAQICESRSRTLKSKPAQIEALQCGSAISRGGRRWLERMREERTTAMPSPDAGVAEQQSVGETITETA